MHETVVSYHSRSTDSSYLISALGLLALVLRLGSWLQPTLAEFWWLGLNGRYTDRRVFFQREVRGPWTKSCHVRVSKVVNGHPLGIVQRVNRLTFLDCGRDRMHTWKFLVLPVAASTLTGWEVHESPRVNETWALRLTQEHYIVCTIHYTASLCIAQLQRPVSCVHTKAEAPSRRPCT
jgi:hypothetical protein